MRRFRATLILFMVLLPILEFFPKTFPVCHEQAQILLCALCCRHVSIVGKVRFRLQDFVQLFITRLFLMREKPLPKQVIPLIVKVFRQVTELREHFIRRVRLLDSRSGRLGTRTPFPFGLSTSFYLKTSLIL